MPGRKPYKAPELKEIAADDPRAVALKIATCKHPGPVDLVVTHTSRERQALRRQWCRDCGAIRMVIGYASADEGIEPWEFPQWVEQMKRALPGPWPFSSQRPDILEPWEGNDSD